MLYFITLACALGCGLMAGLAFSVCVMRALARLAPEHGIDAMRSINIVVINRWFLSVFFGTALLCAGAVIVSWIGPVDRRAWLVLAGSTLHRRYRVGDRALQRAEEQRPCGRGAARSRSGARLGRISVELDRVEPCARRGCRSRRSAVRDRTATLISITPIDLTAAGRVLGRVEDNGRSTEPTRSSNDAIPSACLYR